MLYNYYKANSTCMEGGGGYKLDCKGLFADMFMTHTEMDRGSRGHFDKHQCDYSPP